MEIARQLSWAHNRAEMFHYRTCDDIEVDIVLQDRRRRVVAIEVKASSTVHAEDFRGIRHLAQRIGDDLVAGIVLYTGRLTLPFGGPAARRLDQRVVANCRSGLNASLTRLSCSRVGGSREFSLWSFNGPPKELTPNGRSLLASPRPASQNHPNSYSQAVPPCFGGVRLQAAT